MTPTEPQVDPKGRYTPALAAAALGVSKRTIQRYTDAGLPYIIDRRNGRKAYTGAALIKFWRSIYL
jgi:hypothetical protein